LGDVSLLPAASALASYAPDDGKWEAEGGKVAQSLVSVNSVHLGPWLDALRPVRSKLTAPLAKSFREQGHSESDRTQLTNILADYARDNADLLADLLLDSEVKPFGVLFGTLKACQERAVPLLEAELARKPAPVADAQDNVAQRQARAAVALVRLGQGEKVWALLRHSPDPSVRSFIVNWLNPLGADPHIIAAEFNRIDPSIQPTPAQPPKAMESILFHPQTSKRRALILALGTYGTEGLSAGEQETLTAKLIDLYRNDPDSGIHGAVEWTLRQWKQEEKLRAVINELASLKDRGGRRWFVNRQGQTFAVIEGPVEFRMGSPRPNWIAALTKHRPDGSSPTASPSLPRR
jgi:hypothetical protein